MDQIFGIDKYEKYSKPNKIWDSKMGVWPKRGPQKFKLFNIFSWRHDIFT